MPPARASASQSVSVVPFAGSSWPVTIVTCVDRPRCVTGMPAYAGAAIALVMPGTTSNGTPAPRARLRLFAAAPEHERVAALEPHDLEPGRAALDEQRVDLVLRHRDAARRLADVDELGAGGASSSSAGDASRS